MSSGLSSPTEGVIYRYTSPEEFYNIYEDMEKFRGDLGLCPQENMHFNYLTVIEHLIFFGVVS